MQPIDTASTLILAGNQDAEIAYNNGVQLLNEKKYHEAIKAFDEALRHNPNFYRARQNKAVAYSSLEQYNSAIEELKIVVSAEKTNNRALYALGAAYYQIDKLSEALEYLSNAIQNGYSGFEAFYLAGQAASSTRLRCSNSFIYACNQS